MDKDIIYVLIVLVILTLVYLIFKSRKFNKWLGIESPSKLPLGKNVIQKEVIVNYDDRIKLNDYDREVVEGIANIIKQKFENYLILSDENKYFLIDILNGEVLPFEDYERAEKYMKKLRDSGNWYGIVTRNFNIEHIQEIVTIAYIKGEK